MTCWERVKEGARLIPQTLPLIYIEKNSPTQRQAETLWRFSSDLTCLMQQHTHNTYIHTCTHAQPKGQGSTSPFNSVDIVLRLSFPYAEPGSTGSREKDVTLVPNALQEHRDTGTSMHLIALRGAEISLARKSKEQGRWTYPDWGWAAGE